MKRKMAKGKRSKTNNENMSNTMLYNFNDEELNKTKQYKANTGRKGKNKKEKKAKTKKKHKWLKRIFLTIFLLGLLAAMILAGIIIGIFTSDKYKLTADELVVINQNGKALDSAGNQIATITGSENRKVVSIEEMPKDLPNAFIAIEDKRFYEHKGVDLKRTTYAILMYIKNRGDSDAGGGSTITQQLIKNTKSDSANSGAAGIERKIREIARATMLRKFFLKHKF